MKKTGKIMSLAILSVIFLFPLEQVCSTVGTILPYSCDIEPVSYDKGTGQLSLTLTVTWLRNLPNVTCEMVTLRAASVDGLEYIGPAQWDANVDSTKPYSTMLNVKVPVDDTSGLIITTECGIFTLDWHRYFITTADTVKAVWSDPRYHYNLPEPMTEEERAKLRQKEHERASQEWLEEWEKLRSRRKITTGHGPVLCPEDSVIFDTLSEKGKKLFVRMRYLERTPLTDEERQWFVIGGRWYLRERGEYKFRYVPGRTKEEIRADAQRYWDSLEANPPNAPYDVILDLRDPKDYDYAITLVDSLVPTEEKGFYRTIVNRATLTKLVNKGINQRRANRPPMIPNDTTRQHRQRGPEPEKKSESHLPTHGCPIRLG